MTGSSEQGVVNSFFVCNCGALLLRFAFKHKQSLLTANCYFFSFSLHTILLLNELTYTHYITKDKKTPMIIQKCVPW